MTDDTLAAAVARLREYAGSHATSCPKPDVRTVLAALEAAQADAARYRWLRDTPWSQEMAVVIVAHQNAYWDAAIDAAMKGESRG